MPWVKQETCVGCGICVDVCPVEGAMVVENGKARIIQEKCIFCHKCMEKCPTNSIRPNSENPALRGMRRGRGRGMGYGRGFR